MQARQLGYLGEIFVERKFFAVKYLAMQKKSKEVKMDVQIMGAVRSQHIDKSTPRSQLNFMELSTLILFKPAWQQE